MSEKLEIKKLNGYEIVGEDGATYGRADNFTEAVAFKEQMEVRRNYSNLRNELDEYKGLVEYLCSGLDTPLGDPKGSYIIEKITKFLDYRAQIIKDQDFEKK